LLGVHLTTIIHMFNSLYEKRYGHNTLTTTLK